MNSLEEKFKQLVEWVETNLKGVGQVQSLLAHDGLPDSQFPVEFQGALSFYRSLDGPSQQLLYRVAKNPNTKKTFMTRGIKQTWTLR